MLNGKIMTELCNHMAKTYAFIRDNDTEIKKSQRHKKMCDNTYAYI